MKPLLFFFGCLFAVLLIIPLPIQAGLASQFDAPDTTIASNTVIDIVAHNGGIWMATGEGLNFSLDGGETWLLYDSSNGLVSNDISALFSVDGRLWVATGHSEIVDGQTVGFSDALMYTDDNGDTWTAVDFGDIPHVLGGERVIFDITGYNDAAQDKDWMFIAAFAGSFLASIDGGQSWRRIYSSPSDSVQYNTESIPPVQTRYFSCTVDTTHGDSLFVWAGTAGGVYQYIFAPSTEKPSSKSIANIVYCDNCGGSDTSYVFMGGNNGITRMTSSGGPYLSRFTNNGLPGGPSVTAIYPFAGNLFVGTASGPDGPSTGLVVSSDNGETFTAVNGFDAVTGDNKVITAMTEMRGRLYLAAEEAGLFVSLDTGLSWSHIYVDSSDTSSANGRNVVHALDPFFDTLRVGTDSGLVTLYMDTTGEILSSHYDVFGEVIGFSGARVIKVKTQVFWDSTGMAYDSLAIWTVNRPLTANGSPVVFRSFERAGQSEEKDTAWVSMQWEVNTNDIAFVGDSVFAVGNAGLRFSADGSNPSTIHTVRDSASADRFDDENITAMTVVGDSVFIGTDNGFAISHDRTRNYKIFRVNTDTLAADVVINHTLLSSLLQISGDFIPAIGVQTIDNELGRVWVSARAALTGGGDGISVGLYFPVDSAGTILDSDTDSTFARYDLRWGLSNPGAFAWNFAFNGDTVFAASDAGLLMNYGDTGITWDTVALVDASGNAMVEPGISVYAVEVQDNFLWVGTEQATVRLRLDNMLADTSYFYIDFDTPVDEVYAFPVPFSNSGDDAVDFHFVLQEDADVTLEVYDPAMNLVARLLDNQSLPAGIYHGRNSGVPAWDGRNGKGDQVAVGPYYFKVELSSGDVRWGKLAVIP